MIAQSVRLKLLLTPGTFCFSPLSIFTSFLAMYNLGLVNNGIKSLFY